MKRLTILRHAKSSWADPGMDDFSRPLNERGRSDARRLGEEFKRRGFAFGLVLASPALRVRQTLEGVAEGLGELPITFDEAIYLATEGTLFDLIQSTPAEIGSLLVVGHNPGLERLVVDLSLDDERGLRARASAGLPTGAAALLELPIEDWHDARRASALFADLILPRELD